MGLSLSLLAHPACAGRTGCASRRSKSPRAVKLPCRTTLGLLSFSEKSVGKLTAAFRASKKFLGRPVRPSLIPAAPLAGNNDDQNHDDNERGGSGSGHHLGGRHWGFRCRFRSGRRGGHQFGCELGADELEPLLRVEIARL